MTPKRIAVVGGGTGGTLLANKAVSLLRSEVSSGRVEVHLFADSSEHVFSPGNIDIAFRGAEPSSFRRPERNLLDRRVLLHERAVERVNLEERAVYVDSERLNYDYLVIATGSVARPDAISGLKETSYNFHTGQEDARRTWEALQRFNGGRVLVLTNIPHKCPPSPVEAAFLVEELMRKRGIRERVEVLFATPYARAYPAAAIAEVVEPLMEERGIRLYTMFNTDYVDPKERKVYSLEGEEIGFDLLITVPPHRGADVVFKSEIGDEEGWVAADKETLRHPKFDDVYVVGDATNIPISKSGVVAHLEAIVAAENIAADYLGTGKVYCYTGRINCPLELGGSRAVFVAATYERPPSRQRPSLMKYLMKRAFPAVYWEMLRGRVDPVFDLYLGKPYKVKGVGGA
ncbi:MAG: NAD(P)/FAD-dependent oxidoreductase [Aigarchaeota archaeon]|nr:NAD(P)/FAD-dependent oxidoreductase [Aigarchaeota archaeon]MCS7127378.1 NAD(P)/FAD-dependent oxidoreductase [Candidatus Calditenuaceae archaeon]MDW8042833.1 FAD/NAD(P)-binding oxidoreductase [Nitrososphaerota archaeon]